jgi:hypothetical protein
MCTVRAHPRITEAAATRYRTPAETRGVDASIPRSRYSSGVGRRRWALRIAVLAGPTAIAAACGFDAGGLGSASDDGGGPDVTTFDGPPPGDARGDSRGDAIGDAISDRPGDAGVNKDVLEPPVDACADSGPTETCNNGIDDNCDGLVDCADPMCQATGWTCVPPVPGGWQYLAFSQSAQTCPAPFTTTPLQMNLSVGTSTCSCPCGVANPPTACDTFGIHDCDNNVDIGPFNPPDSSCHTQNISITGKNIKLIAPATGGSCALSGSPIENFPAPSSTPATACSSAPAFGGGCTGGLVCAQQPEPAGSACVWTAGASVSCPSAWTSGATYQVGTGVNDTRNCQCGTCGVPAADCGQASLQLATNGGCGNPDILNAGGACRSYGGPYSSFAYSGGSPGAATCSAANGMVTGGVVLQGPSTVCCAQ